MPLIKVQTSITAPEKAEADKLLKQLSALLAQQLGKPESYVMTALEANVPMTFAGTPEPTCYVEIKSIGLPTEKAKPMSQEFCQALNQVLGIPIERIYIEFADVPRALWGWKGTTF
ncbi:MAG: phenylpyruvate tautomerase MIF-related protein [Microcoleaceae cyanobacterium]